MADFQCQFNNNSVVPNGVVVLASSLVRRSVPVQTDIAFDASDPVGVVGTVPFTCRPVQPLNATRMDILTRVRWEVQATGSAGSTVRVNLAVTQNGVAIAGVAAVNGTTRALDALAAFDEQHHIIIPSLRLDLDDTFELVFQVELVADGIADPAVVRLHHDPAVPGDECLAQMPLLSA